MKHEIIFLPLCSAFVNKYRNRKAREKNILSSEKMAYKVDRSCELQ